MKNLALEVLSKIGASLEEYDGQCGELANEVITQFPDGDILYVEPKKQRFLHHRCGGSWTYHMVPIVNGYVHDAWLFDDALPIDLYLLTAYGQQGIIVAINGEDVDPISLQRILP